MISYKSYMLVTLGACLVVSDETELLAEGGDKFAMGAGMHDGSGA